MTVEAGGATEGATGAVARGAGAAVGWRSGVDVCGCGAGREGAGDVGVCAGRDGTGTDDRACDAEPAGVWADGVCDADADGGCVCGGAIGDEGSGVLCGGDCAEAV